MTQLELQQRGVLNLLKSRGTPPRDPWLRLVEGSRELAMLRKIAIWWRTFQIEAQCRQTSRLLKRLGSFEALVTDYFNRNATSPFIEELSRSFLRSLEQHYDPVVRAVSQLEYAALNAQAGLPVACEILWDRHPDLVCRAIESGAELPPAEPDCFYRLRISGSQPFTLTCTRESTLEVS
jgi:hypothetical protein